MCKASETSSHVLLHLHRHFIALVCQAGNKQMFFRTRSRKTWVIQRFLEAGKSGAEHTQNFEWLNSFAEAHAICWWNTVPSFLAIFNFNTFGLSTTVSASFILSIADFSRGHLQLSPLVPHWSFSAALLLLFWLPDWLSPSLQSYLPDPNPISVFISLVSVQWPANPMSLWQSSCLQDLFVMARSDKV